MNMKNKLQQVSKVAVFFILLLSVFACDKATGTLDTSDATTVEDLDEERQQNQEHVSTIESTPVSAGAGGFFGVPVGVYNGQESSSDDYYQDNLYTYESYDVVNLSGEYMVFDVATSVEDGEICQVGLDKPVFEPVGADSMVLVGIYEGGIDQTGLTACGISDQDIYNMDLDYVSIDDFIQEYNEYAMEYGEESMSRSDYQVLKPTVIEDGFTMPNNNNGTLYYYYKITDYPEFLDYYLN